VTTVVLDTHVLYWVDADPERYLTRTAQRVVRGADEIAIASVSWYELAWLIEHRRIAVSRPLLAYLEDLANEVRTIPLSPAIAAAAVSLPEAFPQDPVDRVIYATAIEYGWPLVTRDESLRSFGARHGTVIW
jgi:PIN domain nuclease of toxin-antitoxin system